MTFSHRIFFLSAVLLPWSVQAMNECMDDPDGILRDDRTSCEAEITSAESCESPDADYNGYNVEKMYQLCPLTCGRCEDYFRPTCHNPETCCCEGNVGGDGSGGDTGCTDDPDGILAAEGSTCDSKFGNWGDDWCDNNDADYNGYNVEKLYQLCPMTCRRCEDYRRPTCHSPEACCCEGNGGGDGGNDQPCITVSRSAIERAESMGYHVRTCEERRQRRRLSGLDPGPPCPGGASHARGLRGPGKAANRTLASGPKDHIPRHNAKNPFRNPFRALAFKKMMKGTQDAHFV